MTTKLEPIILNDITYNKANILGVIQPLMCIHDVLIEQGQVSYAASMYDIKELLVHLANNTDK
jgi:hypothetical protein